MMIQPMLSGSAAADQQDAEGDEEGDRLSGAGSPGDSSNAEFRMQNSDSASYMSNGVKSVQSPCHPASAF